MAESVLHGAHIKAPSAHNDKLEMVPAATDNLASTDSALLSGLNFAKFKNVGFLEVRRGLIEAVHESSTGLSSSQETTDALIDLAELYLTHAMAVEGQSIIAELESIVLPKEKKMRMAMISLALNVLDPRGMELSDADIMLLEGPEKWPEHALLRSLYYIKKDMLNKARPYLAEAVEDILTLPEPIKEMVLPDILEAAIDLSDWGAARKSAEIFIETPALKEGSAYHYLLGRTAEQGQSYLVAFEHFVKATERSDRWAQLSRLSLVKMGLRTKTLTLEDAREIMKSIRFIWRGDALSIEALNLLAATELSLNDIPAALEVLGEIIYTNYDAGTVEEAKKQSEVLLQKYYKDGMSGKTSITAFLRGHKRIAEDYRFQKGYDSFSEKFADKFYEIGASSEAAFEYETTYNYLSVAQDLGLFEVPSERLDQLRIKQATALLRGGQYDVVEAILAFGAESNNSDIQDQFTFLKVELFTQTGNVQSILDTKTREPSIGYLRIKAEAYFSLEDWRNAAKVYCILWKRQGTQFEFKDALNLLLSAYRNNDSKLALELAKSFPDLTTIPQWHQIAAELVEMPSVVGVLKKNTITKGISDASQILEVMELINAPVQ